MIWTGPTSAVTNFAKNTFSSITGGVNNLVGGVVGTSTNLVGGTFDFAKSLVTGNFSGLSQSVTSTTSGLFSGIKNTVSGTISGITDPFKRVETLKENLSNQVINTTKLPTETSNLLNTDKLTSKNFIDIAGNAIPRDIADVKRNSAIDMNLGQIIDCIGDKVKDLLGIFTVGLGIPTLDQFKVPPLTGVGNSISEAFEQTLKDIQNTITGTLDGLENALSLKFLNMNNQQELGRLTLSKFLGCENDITFTKRDKVQVRKQPGIVDKLINKNVDVSKKALFEGSVKEVNQRTGNAFKDTQAKLKEKMGARKEPGSIFDLDVTMGSSTGVEEIKVKVPDETQTLEIITTDE
tara:strand:- start:3456 stop:4505 length:1050 start_codon:yes stop_codon:yes gene_type:complete